MLAYCVVSLGAGWPPFPRVDAVRAVGKAAVESDLNPSPLHCLGICLLRSTDTWCPPAGHTSHTKAASTALCGLSPQQASAMLLAMSEFLLECSALRPRVYQFVQCWSSVLKCDVL